MRGKLLFITGAAVGYVLGARAGRRRYEQIKAGAAKLWETPGIQKQVHQAQDYAADKLGEVPGAVIEGAKKVIAKSVSPKKPVSQAPAETSAGAAADSNM